MKLTLKKQTGSAAVAEELARIEIRKAEAERKRSETLQALEDARQARRDGLSSEDFDLAASAKRIRELDGAAADLEVLISDLEAAHVATSERLRASRDGEARAAVAGKLEAMAAAADTAGTDVEKAVLGLGKAVRALLATVAPDLGLFPAYHMDRPEERPEARNVMASPREAVAAALADALAAELPEVFDHYRENGYRRALFSLMDARAPQPSFRSGARTNPLRAREAVSALVVDRIRARAAAIISGDAPAEISDIRPPEPPKKHEKRVSLTALVDVGLYLPNGYQAPVRRIITEGRQESFAPHHAELLIATAAFAPTESEEVKKLLAKQEERREREAAQSSREPASHQPGADEPLTRSTTSAIRWVYSLSRRKPRGPWADRNTHRRGLRLPRSLAAFDLDADRGLRIAGTNPSK